jgi:hypothetical protein
MDLTTYPSLLARSRMTLPRRQPSLVSESEFHRSTVPFRGVVIAQFLDDRHPQNIKPIFGPLIGCVKYIFTERFHEERLGVYRRAKTGCRHKAGRIFRKISESGGLVTTGALFAHPAESKGFPALASPGGVASEQLWRWHSVHWGTYCSMSGFHHLSRRRVPGIERL